MYKLCFYVPVEYSEPVKQAVFNAGGGHIGEYSDCSFDSLGTGQFMPNEVANPSIGKANTLEKVAELKVELVCDKKTIKPSVEAMIKAHPYETPAYQIFPFLTLEDL